MKSLKSLICEGLISNPYEITHDDVGRPFGETLSGLVVPYDVGKQVQWVRGDGNGRAWLSLARGNDCYLQIENKEQRDARRIKRAIASLRKRGTSKFFV